MNIQSLETASRRHAMQLMLDQTKPDFVVLIGTKLTSMTATRKMFNGYKAFHSHTLKHANWIQRATGQLHSSKGVTILVKNCYDVGQVNIGSGLIEGRFASLTMYVNTDGTGQKPWALKIGGAYYDCEHKVTEGRRALSTAIANDINESLADEIHYQTDSNCPYQATDLAERIDET